MKVDTCLVRCMECITLPLKLLRCHFFSLLFICHLSDRQYQWLLTWILLNFKWYRFQAVFQYCRPSQGLWLIHHTRIHSLFAFWTPGIHIQNLRYYNTCTYNPNIRYIGSALWETKHEYIYKYVYIYTVECNKYEHSLCFVILCYGVALIDFTHQCYCHGATENDDVIKWKHFPRYWPFVWGIDRSSVNSRTKASDAELCCFL